MTTVEVKDAEWKRLNRLKSPGESMNDVIKRLLETHETAHEPPTEQTDDTEQVPWCDACECFSVPTEDGTCGDCGEKVRLRVGAE